MTDNGLMMQYFEASLRSDCGLWRSIKKEASKLAAEGVTSLWLPPAYKGAAGVEDMGYDVYDLYDLGEFKQKGTMKTKYGTKKDYLEAIETLHALGINVYADVVLGRRSGADDIEIISAEEFNELNHYQMIGDKKRVGAVTKFSFPGRKGKYSDFKWDWKCFRGINWDQKQVLETVKDLPEDKLKKLKACDYIMDADIDFENHEVFEELVHWALWYLETTGVDGFRLDGAKDIPAMFSRDFMYRIRENCDRELFTVGDYWNGDVNVLERYLEDIKSEASLFDVPLHYNFYHCSQAHGDYDLRGLFDGTLMRANPIKAVTFVDSHSTQPGQPMESFVEEWFKPHAYASILLRNEGYPCVFYGDYNGIQSDKIKPHKTMLNKLMKLRKTKAYGIQHDYLDDPNCIGWTREGDGEHPDSGLAVIMSDGAGGTKRMYIGRQFAGAHFSDVMGNAKYNIKIDDEGCGNFYVNRDSVAVWVRREPK